MCIRILQAWGHGERRYITMISLTYFGGRLANFVKFLDVGQNLARFGRAQKVLNYPVFCIANHWGFYAFPPLVFSANCAR